MISWRISRRQIFDDCKQIWSLLKGIASKFSPFWNWDCRHIRSPLWSWLQAYWVGIITYWVPVIKIIATTCGPALNFSKFFLNLIWSPLFPPVVSPVFHSVFHGGTSTPYSGKRIRLRIKPGFDLAPSSGNWLCSSPDPVQNFSFSDILFSILSEFLYLNKWHLSRKYGSHQELPWEFSRSFRLILHRRVSCPGKLLPSNFALVFGNFFEFFPFF